MTRATCDQFIELCLKLLIGGCVNIAIYVYNCNGYRAIFDRNFIFICPLSGLDIGKDIPSI